MFSSRNNWTEIEAGEDSSNGPASKGLKWRMGWFAAVLVICLASILFVYDDYGVSWDTALLTDYGESVLDYYESGFTSRKYMDCDDAHYYGSSVELLAASIYTHFPHYKYEIHHWVCALFALLTLAGIMAFACLFRDRYILIFVPILLVMLPRFSGHAFINSKDIPFACGFAWTMFATALLFRGKRFSWPKFLFFGLCLGATLSIRTGGILAFCFFGVQAAYYMLVNKKWQNHTVRENSLLLAGLGLKTIVAIVLAWIIMVAFWPWALERPIVNPIKAFELATHFYRKFHVLFQDRLVWSNELPWYYLPWFLLITTPILTTVLALAGTWLSLSSIVKAPRAKESQLYVGLLFWFWFPVVYVVLTGPNIYDGIRHFLFILPGLALLAALGAGRTVALIPIKVRSYAIFGMAVFLSLPLVDMIGLHPYEMTFFNSITGKVGGAYGKYEMDYWLTSYKECMEWLAGKAAQSPKPIRVLVAVEPRGKSVATYYAPPNCQLSFSNLIPGDPYLPDTIDYYVASSRFFWHILYPKEPVVFAVGRQGAVYSVIRARKTE